MISTDSKKLRYRDEAAPVQAVQLQEEFTRLLGLFEQARPQRVLEIGVLEGGTLYQWLSRMDPGGLVVAVDLPGARWGHSWTWNPERWKGWGEALGMRVEPVLGDVNDDHIVEQVRGHAPFDYIFVDGDHRYEPVKETWERYNPMLRSGGLFVLHDILPHATNPRVEVHRLWAELQGNPRVRQRVELISYDGQAEMGIGVLWLS